MSETTLFNAEHKTESFWQVTVDGVTVKLTDVYMGEVVSRYLKANSLRAVDVKGNYVHTGWKS